MSVTAFLVAKDRLAALPIVAKPNVDRIVFLPIWYSSCISPSNTSGRKILPFCRSYLILAIRLEMRKPLFKRKIWADGFFSWIEDSKTSSNSLHWLLETDWWTSLDASHWWSGTEQRRPEGRFRFHWPNWVREERLFLHTRPTGRHQPVRDRHSAGQKTRHGKVNGNTFICMSLMLQAQKFGYVLVVPDR